MKIGASSAHLAIAAGMIRSTIDRDEDQADQQPDGADVGSSSKSPSLTAATSAMLRVVEVGDELRDQQEQEEQAREPGPRLRDRVEHLVACP